MKAAHMNTVDPKDPKLTMAEGGIRPKGKALPGFPWLPVGATVIVAFVPRGVKEMRSGILLVEGKEESQRKGLVLSVGPGEPIPGCGWVSPKMHFGVEPGDIVFVESGVGIPIRLGNSRSEYHVLRMDDIRMRLDPGVGRGFRSQMLQWVNDRVKEMEEAGDDKGGDIREVDHAQKIEEVPRMTPEEYVEHRRSQRGKGTKIQVTVPRKSEE